MPGHVFLHHSMNSLNTLPYFFLNITRPSKFTPPQLSFSTRRRSGRPRRTHHFSDNNSTTTHNPSFDHDNINLLLDFNQISILSSSKSKLHQFLSATEEAYTDLRNVIRVDDHGRLFVSCRKSTLQFVGGFFFAGFLLVFVFRAFVKLGLGFRSRFGVGKQSVVVRRDRSLGGREVVVGTRDDVYRNTTSSKALKNPLSPGTSSGFPTKVFNSIRLPRTANKLPKWWSFLEAAEDRTLVVDKEDYQREANRLIRAIIDQRTSGQDIMADDIIQSALNLQADGLHRKCHRIINSVVSHVSCRPSAWMFADPSICTGHFFADMGEQLRRICRTSGVRVSIETINTRDSIYRTAVDFVLSVCSRAPNHSTSVLIDGEDACHFVAGLADNIGLENIRAARMVSAAVAARTRSRFLQAWALEMQGNHPGALLELSKICLVFRIFPPEESSVCAFVSIGVAVAPEMEMVARGLEKLLKVEQREFLMNMLAGVCSEESHRSAAEALGLVFSAEGNGDQHETSIHEN
ncbi:hypothetical protein EZV62_001463 [Acer yangbiense]|uniref:Uncharacterized protein n=1 Tax=Acer yangbiense TaxID=1000413 RepID=A0A5C7IVI3_9ROSI|nr:hypothetical protein EZV62_001463 [Acer yangbiense]